MMQGVNEMDSDADEDEDVEVLASSGSSKSRLKVSDSTGDALRRFISGTPLSITRALQFHTVSNRTYCRSSRHKGNSSILVKTNPTAEPVPAQIQDIVQTNTGEILIAIRYHGKPTAQDPFVKYPLLGISLWTEPEGLTTIISPANIHSHFASCPFPTEATKDHITVISLSRVCQKCLWRICDNDTNLLAQEC